VVDAEARLSPSKPWVVAALGHRFESFDIERDVFNGAAEIVDGEALGLQERSDLLRRTHGVLLGSKGEIDASTIQAMPSCRVIVRYGIGVDNVDIEAATSNGIWVANVPDYCVDEVATHTAALVLAANRRLAANFRAAGDGNWSFSAMKGVAPLSQQCLGLVGFGRIGHAVATKLAPLVGSTIAYDEWVDDQVLIEAGVTPVSLVRLVAEADYLSIHCPLVPETRGLVSEAVLSAMKPSAWIVNTARGEIIDENALVKALRGGTIAGAALDVLASEPPDASHPLLHAANVIITPHVAHYSDRSTQELQRRAALAARSALEGSPPASTINPHATQRSGNQPRTHGVRFGTVSE